jgi:hypothetical protein
MKKRKLVIDDLQVESFDTGVDLPRRGTVRGYDYETPACDTRRVCEPYQHPSDAVITCDTECTYTLYTFCPYWCDPGPTEIWNQPC